MAGQHINVMDMVVQTMLDVGVEPRMTRATVEMLHWTASLGLKEQFGGEVPSNWQTVVDEIFRRIRVY